MHVYSKEKCLIPAIEKRGRGEGANGLRKPYSTIHVHFRIL
jgi:hypothetical protein